MKPSSLYEALYNTLTGDNDVAAQFSTRWYATRARTPATPVYPYGVFFIVSGNPGRMFRHEKDWETLLVQVDVFDDDLSVAAISDLIYLVDAAMHNQDLTIIDPEQKSIHCQRATAPREIQEEQIAHGIMEFEITAQERAFMSP